MYDSLSLIISWVNCCAVNGGAIIKWKEVESLRSSSLTVLHAWRASALYCWKTIVTVTRKTSTSGRKSEIFTTKWRKLHGAAYPMMCLAHHGRRSHHQLPYSMYQHTGLQLLPTTGLRPTWSHDISASTALCRWPALKLRSRFVRTDLNCTSPLSYTPWYATWTKSFPVMWFCVFCVCMIFL